RTPPVRWRTWHAIRSWRIRSAPSGSATSRQPRVARWNSGCATRSSRRTSRYSTTRRSAHSRPCRSIATGASRTCRRGSAMAARFDYRQAQEIAAAFERHGARYLFLGKSGAIILGYPDTTQDADLFVEKSPANGRAIVAALRELGFPLPPDREAEIER